MIRTWLSRIWSSPSAMGFVFTSTIFVVSFFYFPADHPRFFLCPFKTFTGIDCPGCGMTRAFCALAKGEMTRAIHFHPLSPLVFGLFGLWWLTTGLSLLGYTGTTRKIGDNFGHPIVVFGIMGLLVVAWIFRLGWQFFGE